MSDHRDPGDLGLLLADMARDIEMLRTRPTPGDWQTFVPNIRATVTNPNKGANLVAKGDFVVTSHGTCFGRATMRFQASMTRGSGIYMFKLPLAGMNSDPRGASPINGGITIGYSSVIHEVGGALHFCGLAGFRSTEWAVATIQGGLFVSHDDPASGLDIQNIHYWFEYPLADEE